MTAQRMDIDLRERWVSALRHGEYRQGRGQLCKRAWDGTLLYCPLGVLACVMGWTWEDVNLADGFGSTVFMRPVPPYQPLNPYQGPTEVIAEGGRMAGRVSSEIIRLSDDKGATFDEIAAYIASNA